jgi:signal transduction histidine kinase
LLLIAAGTTGVAIAAVYRLMQPLALLQRTVARISPDGEVPQLPEIGPAEVRATARAINLLSSRLSSAMESRMRLVAAAGHDLRTPLTRMRLRAEFLGDDAEREKWLKDLNELDRIADSAIRLVREEIEASANDVLRLDVLVEEVVSELKDLQLDICLERATPVSVKAKPLSLKRALRNLIINAATHGKEAKVSVGPADGTAQVEIIDQGPGIPEDMLKRACEPFFRVDPARRVQVPGAGLGLAIAQEIIQRHVGRLHLANRPGGGLMQRVELPLATKEA